MAWIATKDKGSEVNLATATAVAAVTNELLMYIREWMRFAL